MKFPKEVPVLETPRLILKEITMDMAHDYFYLCSQKEVMQMYGLNCHNDLDQTKSVISLLRREFLKNESIRWGVIAKERNRFIGDAGIWRFISFRARGEIGAKLLPKYHSKGLITEALAKIIDFGFTTLGLNSIEGNVDPDNNPSHRLVEKLGMEKEGYIKEHSYCAWKKCYVDTILYSLRKSKWQHDQIL